jgi:hypothetical protein
MAHPTVEHNKAHREDLNWIKVGRKEYMNGSGEVIRYNNNRFIWDTFAADGTQGYSFQTLWVSKMSVADGLAFR